VVSDTNPRRGETWLVDMGLAACHAIGLTAIP
jgi:hypothetical protein